MLNLIIVNLGHFLIKKNYILTKKTTKKISNIREKFA